MAHWGVAMSLWHPLWESPSNDEMEEAIESLDKALDLSNTTTERELV